MRDDLLQDLGASLRTARQGRRLTQPMIARRLGRTASRISEFETDLLEGRIGRDRLSLLVELCDVLELVPILVPRERAKSIRSQLDTSPLTPGPTAGRVFDDVFVDLSDDDEEGDG